MSGDILVSVFSTKRPELVSYSPTKTIIRRFDLSENFLRPFYSQDENLVIGLVPGMMTFSGLPGYLNLKTGRISSCGDQFYDSIIDDPRSENRFQVIITDTTTVVSYDLETCEIIEMLFDIKPNLNGNEYFFIDSSSLASDGIKLYYSLGRPLNGLMKYVYTIYVLDLKTAETSEIGLGFYPMISHDGEKLAYFYENGLYIYDVLGGGTELIQTFINVDQNTSPTIDWSGDNSHLLIQTIDYSKEPFLEQDIYIFNLSNKALVEIPVKGLHPSWVR